MSKFFIQSIISFLLTASLLVSHAQVTAQSSGLSKLTQAEISPQLENLSGWIVEDEALRCTYEFKNFVEAVNFVNLLVEPSETAQHHPDLIISYNRVTIILTTHDAGGITQKDLDLAKIISQLFKTTL